MKSPKLIRLSKCALCAIMVGVAAVGCSASVHPPPAPCPVVSVADKNAGDTPAHVYRLDFVVVSGEGGAPGVKEQFTMNVAERQHGDLSVGRNVPLQTNVTAGNASPRTDVGMHLGADCRGKGDDLFLQVRMDVSDPEASPGSAAAAIHKATASSDALVKLGQPALVLKLDDGHRQYEVSVTATRLG